MCFITNNPEELRDFDHYVSSAQGKFAYKDFVWIYGPLSPIVYGAVLKVLPHRLISVRLFSLALWAVGAAFLALIFARFYHNPKVILGATLFASGIFGYPSYSHNHVMVAVALIGATYYLLDFFDFGAVRSLYTSFGLVLVCLFARPVLMGYGILAAWMGFFLAGKNNFDKPKQFSLCIAATLVSLMVFYAFYGTYLGTAFFPRSWAVLEAKSYPNLHYLFPRPDFRSADWLGSFFKQVRGALETAIFYGHYFILPTVMLTITGVIKFRSDLRAGFLCAVMAWMASFDILHYGFSDPMMEPVMAVRGQYFLPLSAVALFLLLWQTWATRPKTDPKKWAAVAVLAVVGLWSYGNYFIGLSHLVRYPINAYRFPILAGIGTSPERSAIFQAATFVNSLCGSDDSVVLPQYDPGIARILTCPDVFHEDAYAFTRMPWYVLQPGESPYIAQGNMTNGEVIERRLAEFKPRFFITHLASNYDEKCRGLFWQTKDFGSGTNGRRVCWRAK